MKQLIRYMNITDLIVEFIKQGNVVEFPGMGTLSGNNVSAHHDAATGTYYPARRTVTMVESLTGNKAVIRYIAEKECVTNEIAEQMWVNYMAALKDKLQRSPSGHEFPGIGVMRYVGTKVKFDAVEGLDLDADKKHEQPLENVSTYTPKTVADPFAAFDKPAAAKPAVDAETKENPAPVAEPAAKSAEPTPVAVVPPVATPAPEPVKAEPVKQESPSTADHLSEVKRMLDEIPASPKSTKEIKRAEKAAAKAEKEARKAAEEAEKAKAKEREKASARAAKEKEEARRSAEEAEKRMAKEKEKAERAALKQEKAEKKEKKEKQNHAWLWILIILLLLLIGGGGYYLTRVYSPAAKGESCARKVELSYSDQFTNDIALLKFEEQDIRNNVGNVHGFMADYIKNFLVSRHYGNAFAAVMAKVDEYADNRLHELMVEGYCVKRFFPYEDFWFERNYDAYKDRGAHIHRCTVQGELMNEDLLDGILDDVVVAMGLHPDGFGYGYAGGGGAAANGKNATAKPANDKPYEEVVPEAPTFRNSKQGFDIVAGFFTSKKSANKCANQLKALGSDAYIISKSGGYYVSMGSAPTRTAAEAMEKHIKSWYKSDVKIYNFNE